MELSRRTRDERDRDSGKHYKDRDHKHRSSNEKSRDADEDDLDQHRSEHSKHRDGDHDRRRSRADRDEYRRSSREYSQEPRSEREGSRDGRERLYEREEPVDRRHSSSQSSKRKERGESEDRFDGTDKKVTIGDGAMEKKRRFEDKVVNGAREFSSEAITGVSSHREGRREKRKLDDIVKREYMDGKQESFDGRTLKEEPKSEQFDYEQVAAASNGSTGRGAGLEPLNMETHTLPEIPLAPSHPSATKYRWDCFSRRQTWNSIP